DEEWRSALDEELRQLWAAVLLELEEKRAALQSKVEKGLEQVQSAYPDKLRTPADENRKLREENSEGRAPCAGLHEARGLLDFIKTQCAPDRPRSDAGQSRFMSVRLKKSGLATLTGNAC